MWASAVLWHYMCCKHVFMPAMCKRIWSVVCCADLNWIQPEFCIITEPKLLVQPIVDFIMLPCRVADIHASHLLLGMKWLSSLMNPLAIIWYRWESYLIILNQLIPNWILAYLRPFEDSWIGYWLKLWSNIMLVDMVQMKPSPKLPPILK